MAQACRRCGRGATEPPRCSAVQAARPRHAGEQELHRAALAANALSRVYAQVTGRLCARAGLSAAQREILGTLLETIRVNFASNRQVAEVAHG